MFDIDGLFKSLTADKGARSRQVEIGPSEIGGCRRKLWYRLRDQPVTNPDTLNMASWMGTAIHDKLEKALRHADPFGDKYKVEVEIESDGLIGTLKGHADLYIPSERLVIDWKTTTKKNMAKFPSQQQRWQVQVYGAMLNAEGMPCDEVALVAIARDGNENDVKIHREPFDMSVVVEAMDWLEAVMAFDEPAPADNHPRFCRDYCNFYDASGNVGCVGKS